MLLVGRLIVVPKVDRVVRRCKISGNTGRGIRQEFRELGCCIRGPNLVSRVHNFWRFRKEHNQD